jgi:hypothetical protein
MLVVMSIRILFQPNLTVALAPLTSALAALVIGTAPAGAQQRAHMGVSVVVAPAAPSAFLSGQGMSMARRSSSEIEFHSTLSVTSGTSYTLRLRSDQEPGTGDVRVRLADGTFATVPAGGTTELSRHNGAAAARPMDLVVKMAQRESPAALTAELVSARLDL